MTRFQGGLVFKAHRLSHHSTQGSRVITKRKYIGAQGIQFPHTLHSASVGAGCEVGYAAQGVGYGVEYGAQGEGYGVGYGAPGVGYGVGYGAQGMAYGVGYRA